MDNSKPIRDISINLDAVSLPSVPTGQASKVHSLLTLVTTIGASLIKESQRIFESYFFNKFNELTDRRVYDTNALISGHKKMESAQAAWLLNLALMRDAANVKGLSCEQQKQIKFLISNYLHKNAPIHFKTMRSFFKNLDSFQVCGLSTKKDYYHRFSLSRQIKLGAKANESLAMANKSPLISTDDIEFLHLLPLRYTVRTSGALGSQDLIGPFSEHFSSADPLQALDKNLSAPFMFDLTDYLKNEIETNGIKAKEEIFKDKYDLFKSKLEEAIQSTVNRLVEAHPQLGYDRRKLKAFIKKQMTCICRVQTQKATGMKALPLYADISKTKVLKVHHELSEFIIATGIGIGAVSLRKEMLDALGQRQDIKYEGPAAHAGVKYFPEKVDFTNLAIFQRLAAAFGVNVEPLQVGFKPIDQSAQINAMKEQLTGKPHIQLLGKATIDLLNGLIQGIDQEKWEELHSNEAYVQIIQASLYKIREHFAAAEFNLRNFAEFAQNMELISAEMATLLEIIKPYADSDFAAIYRNALFSNGPMSSLPIAMQNQFQFGLSKTSVNTFAGINAAVLSINPHPQRVYSAGFYFEQAGFIGYDRSFESIMNDSLARKIDLYCGQFNPNIEIDKDFTHYSKKDIAADVREMLDKGNAAKHLTIAIDCTIDDYNSESIKNLLESFEGEINAGQLNFVFFRSGLKVDLLGMDNYYGSPFYMINNGAAHWKAFTSLATSPVHKTDSLSTQWFSLSNQFIPDSLEEYRRLIFSNTRAILDQVPEKLKPGAPSSNALRVNTAEDDMKAAFIDIKVVGMAHKLTSAIILGKFYQKMMSKGIKVQTRATFGLYHVNALIISVNEVEGGSTIRLHPGINPEENEAFIEFFNELADESPHQKS